MDRPRSRRSILRRCEFKAMDTTQTKHGHLTSLAKFKVDSGSTTLEQVS